MHYGWHVVITVCSAYGWGAQNTPSQIRHALKGSLLLCITEGTASGDMTGTRACLPLWAAIAK